MKNFKKKLLLIFAFLFVKNIICQDPLAESKSEVDVKRKAKECQQLTSNAAKYLATNTIETACNHFIHKAIWRKGEIFPFIIRQDGVIMCHGDDTDIIWKNISTVKGISGDSLIKEMLHYKKQRHISYFWDNAYKSAYIEPVVKNNITYLVGSGFFPENDEYTVKQIVDSAAGIFLREGKDVAFSLINNPNGPFVKGDIYAFAYDFDGVCVAHGSNAALIGQSLINEVDSRGKKFIQEMINIAKTKGRGWVNYTWRNAPKRSYVEKVVDPKTKKPYFISAGYYPTVTLTTLQTYLNRAIKYLKSEGAKEAFSEFSNQVGEFAYAGLGIFVYDFEGKCWANGENPGFVGQNFLNQKDPMGRYIVKDMINVAKKNGKGIVSYFDSNAYTIAYIEAVDIPDGKFVIGAQFHPASKVQAAKALVSRAIRHLKENASSEAFREFMLREGQYLRGDLHIFVYDNKGTRLVNGIHTQQIWHNFLKTADQEGKAVVGDIISRAVNGGGWVEYQVRNATRRVYAKAVSVQDKSGLGSTFIVGSGYFL